MNKKDEMYRQSSVVMKRSLVLSTLVLMSLSTHVFANLVEGTIGVEASLSAVNTSTDSAEIDALLSKMTLEEKIGQMNQVNYLGSEASVIEAVGAGKVGSILNPIDASANPNVKGVNEVQRIAVEKTRLGIPLIIGRDVIHGFKTVFPLPLGLAATFNPKLVEEGARVSAIEARASGIHLTFSPMLDISRDARWGRIAESFGEDTYLTTAMGVAMVKGYQTDDLRNATSLAATAKHFVGYGAAEGGRDYNSTSISPYSLRNTYLPPFKATVDAGVASIMTSFNENDGIPATGDRFLLKTLLRDEWKFTGFVVTDWNSTGEMVDHGFAKDNEDAARIAANAGVDMEMTTGAFVDYLPELIKTGKVSVSVIDDAVRNILRIKFRMGLFDNPYFDESAAAQALSNPLHLEKAKQAAVESTILLKNANKTLPLTQVKKVAIIGPLADQKHEQLGTWAWDGNRDKTITPLAAFKENSELEVIFEAGLTHARDKKRDSFDRVKDAVAQSDVAIVFLGEESILSGEAHSLANLNLVGEQSELLSEVKRVGKPVILVIMAGRPLTIEKNLIDADAVLYSFHPGTMGGPAIVDLIMGKENPSGKLPVTFVREVGQIPLYYNHNSTGRPTVNPIIAFDDIPVGAEQTSLGNTSFYLDAGKDPLYHFGYGLSYSTFEYADLTLSTDKMTMREPLRATVTITNRSDRAGTEVVQLYLRDKVGSIVRPIKELKGFQRIFINAGESKNVTFELTAAELAFYGAQMKFAVEPGDFDLWIGTDSQQGLTRSFTLVE